MVELTFLMSGSKPTYGFYFGGSKDYKRSVMIRKFTVEYPDQLPDDEIVVLIRRRDGQSLEQFKITANDYARALILDIVGNECDCVPSGGGWVVSGFTDSTCADLRVRLSPIVPRGNWGTQNATVTVGSDAR